MNRVLVVGSAVVGLVGVAATPSDAAAVRECGDMPRSYAGNITARVVTCREARMVVATWNRTVANRSGTGMVRGLYCRYRDTGYEAGDIRCTGSRGRVVHWQTGS
jgi:hypothetical protein